MKVGYERDFLRYLQSLLAEVERRIRRGHARLALSQNQQSSGVSLEESLRQIIFPLGNTFTFSLLWPQMLCSRREFCLEELA